MPSIQIFLYVLSLALVLAWILNTENVEYKIVKDNYHSQCDYVYISSGEETNWYSILALSVIGFWTTFWNVLLLKFLQGSRRIERSAVFLFQQSILLHLIIYGLVLTAVIFLWAKHSFVADNLYLGVNMQLEEAFFIQNIFFCMYIGLRFYLTYHRNGTIRVVFDYKMFLFFLTITVPIAVFYISSSSQLLSLSGFIFLETIKLCLFAGIFKRRHKLQRKKIQQHATWIWTIIVDSYALVWGVNKNIIYDNCTRHTSNYFHIYNTKLIYSFILLGPSLAAFSVIITDDNLRKSYLEDFDLTRCCGDDGGGGSDRSGTQQNEHDPLLGNSNQPHYGEIDEANAQRTGNGDDKHNAHEGRTTEDKVRCMPHQDNSDDVKYGAHAQQTRNNEDKVCYMPHQDNSDDVKYGAHAQQTRNNEDEIHCMPHQDNSDDVKYGAHKAPDKDEDDILYRAAQSPSGPYQIIGRTQHQISNQTTQHKDKELLDIVA